MSGLLTEGCVLGTALAGLERGYEVYVAVDATAGETLETHQVAIQRMIQAGAVPVTWLSLASQYQGSYTNHQTVPRIPGPDDPALAGIRNAPPAASSPASSARRILTGALTPKPAGSPHRSRGPPKTRPAHSAGAPPVPPDIASPRERQTLTVKEL